MGGGVLFINGGGGGGGGRGRACFIVFKLRFFIDQCVQMHL